VIENGIRKLSTPLTLGDGGMDHCIYDEGADVLYLTDGPPRLAADDDESREGDTVFFDADGGVLGVTIIGAREVLDRDGTLDVTLPSRGIVARWPRAQIEPLLHETIRY
jgi:uncharacterized protein YuzE